MKIKEVRSGLSDILAPLMGEHGFADRNHEGNFTRKSGDFIWIFDVHVVAKTGWFFTKPFVGIGCPVLNKLYNQILQPRDRLRVNGFTFGCVISHEYPGRGDYNIENADDIISAAAKIKCDFVEIAPPYYEKNKNLELAEKSLNPKTPDGAYVPTTVYGACIGLIAAHLCGRPDFEAMADFHHDFIARVQRKEFAVPILRVKEFYLNPKRTAATGTG